VMLGVKGARGAEVLCILVVQLNQLKTWQHLYSCNALASIAEVAGTIMDLVMWCARPHPRCHCLSRLSFLRQGHSVVLRVAVLTVLPACCLFHACCRPLLVVLLTSHHGCCMCVMQLQLLVKAGMYRKHCLSEACLGQYFSTQIVKASTVHRAGQGCHHKE